MSYPPGVCPVCSLEFVAALPVVQNRFRRDIFVCPHCNTQVLRCRMLFCHNYAAAGDLWDNELCPPCFAGVVDMMKKTPTVVMSAVGEMQKRQKELKTQSVEENNNVPEKSDL